MDTNMLIPDVSDRDRELTEMILKGWGDTPQFAIPVDWRERQGPSHGFGIEGYQKRRRPAKTGAALEPLLPERVPRWSSFYQPTDLFAPETTA